jgi:branched-chain amino acid transport system ATP-binding protein
MKGLGRSFQITSVFENLSVEENFALAILAQNGHNFRFWRRALSLAWIQKELGPAMARVDLKAQAGVSARNLSHGERRQLEVGMALTGSPALLMLDEPMAGQGAGGTVELAKIIGRLKGQMGVLLVEHDMDVVFALADRITVLVYGKAIATGTPEEIRNNSTVQEAYLGGD